MARPTREQQLASLESRLDKITPSPILMAYTTKGKQQIDCVEVFPDGSMKKRKPFRNVEKLQEYDKDLNILLDGQMFRICRKTQNRIIKSMDTDALLDFVSNDPDRMEKSLQAIKEGFHKEVNLVLKKAGILPTEETPHVKP